MHHSIDWQETDKRTRGRTNSGRYVSGLRLFARTVTLRKWEDTSNLSSSVVFPQTRSIASSLFDDEEISGEAGFELENQLFGGIMRGFGRNTLALILSKQTWLATETVEDFRRLIGEQLTGDLGGGAKSGKFEFAVARRTPRHTTNSTINTLQSLTLKDDKNVYQDSEAEHSNFMFHRTGICGTHYMNTQAATER